MLYCKILGYDYLDHTTDESVFCRIFPGKSHDYGASGDRNKEDPYKVRVSTLGTHHYI